MRLDARAAFAVHVAARRALYRHACQCEGCYMGDVARWLITYDWHRAQSHAPRRSKT